MSALQNIETLLQVSAAEITWRQIRYQPIAREPDPEQILPGNAQEALLASIKSRYEELASPVNAAANFHVWQHASSLKHPAPQEDFLPKATDERFLARLDQSPLTQGRLADFPFSELIHPPRGIHVLSLRRLHLSLLANPEDSRTLRYIMPMLENGAKNTDIRMLTGKHLEPCTRRIASMPPQAHKLLAQNMSNLLMFVSVSGAHFDRLDIPRPDYMDNHALERDKTAKRPSNAHWLRLLRGPKR